MKEPVFEQTAIKTLKNDLQYLRNILNRETMMRVTLELVLEKIVEGEEDPVFVAKEALKSIEAYKNRNNSKPN
jgi:hypothetical protein